MSACVKCGHDPAVLVAARWTITIAALEVKSLNAHAVNAGHARHAYRRSRDQWQWTVTAARLAQRIPVAQAKRRVTIRRIIGYRQREFDLDNLVGGCKPLVDALVRDGLLVGDRRDQAEISYEQVKVDGGRGVVVVLEELGP